jgi:hypothetical protein
VRVLEVPRFSIFGPPVVNAARMAMTAKASSAGNAVVHLSDSAAKELLCQQHDLSREQIVLQKRGEGMIVKVLY